VPNRPSTARVHPTHRSKALIALQDHGRIEKACSDHLQNEFHKESLKVELIDVHQANQSSDGDKKSDRECADHGPSHCIVQTPLSHKAAKRFDADGFSELGIASRFATHGFTILMLGLDAVSTFYRFVIRIDRLGIIVISNYFEDGMD